MEEKVKQTIEKYNLIQTGDNVILGVSGGPDSLCLLYLLYDLMEYLNFKLTVCHVNHMLRKEAKEEASFVLEVCKSLDIPCFIHEVSISRIAKENKIGLEEAGRNVRYNFFDEIAKKIGASKIATAHHLKDNAETVLMNIIRGSGIIGLKGIEPIREQKYIRPLIFCTREEIEKYCSFRKLSPKQDMTNFDNTYTRNKVRNVLIPFIEKEFNQSFEKSISRLSEIAREESDFLDRCAKMEYKNIVINENDREIIINLHKFNNLELVIKKRILLYTINKLCGNANISKIHIEDILKLCTNNIGNKYLVPNKKIKILVKSGKIFFILKSEYP